MNSQIPAASTYILGDSKPVLLFKVLASLVSALSLPHTPGSPPFLFSNCLSSLAYLFPNPFKHPETPCTVVCDPIPALISHISPNLYFFLSLSIKTSQRLPWRVPNEDCLVTQTQIIEKQNKEKKTPLPKTQQPALVMPSSF